MRINRRGFILSASALAVTAGRGIAASPMPELVAAPSRAQLAPDTYPDTAVWSYNGGIPGPEIRLPQGAELTRRLVNNLPEETSIHWHGIRIDNAMDGVPGLTQDAVAPGGSFDYAFRLPDAGTYWYHTHNRSWEQMARGLAGPLIVEEADGPDVDADITLAVSDWRLTREAAMSEDFGMMHDLSHAGRIGNLLTVNGAFEFRQGVKRGDRVRLRLINMATARILSLELPGFDGWIVALDGMPLETPQRAERLTLAPAQRVDVIADVTADEGSEANLVQFARDGGFALAAFPVAAGGAARGTAPKPLPPNPVPQITLAEARNTRLTMEGGAMGGMSAARYKGERLSTRDLVQQGQVWALNGTAGLDEEPFFTLDRGEAIRIPMVNDTAFPHGIHLHGHHFREVTAEGLGPWRDTILLDRGETREIVLQGDNPGDWLLHCHMLGHQAAGMKTWFRVL